MNAVRTLAAPLLLLAAASPASAAPSYDGCTGFIASLPATLTQQGTWCLNKDLATPLAAGTAITIQNHNITIDCNGFKIGGLAAGMGTQTVGLRSVDRLNTTIRDCRIRGFLVGVSITGDGSGHVVEDNLIEASTLTGLAFSGTGSVIRRNRIVDTGGSTFSPGNAVGMTVSGTADIVDNGISGVVPYSDPVEGSNNTFGIFVSGGSGLRITGNQVRGVEATGWGLAHAIAMSGTSRSQVADNFIAGPGYAGIFCGSGTDAAWRNHLTGFSVDVWICTDADNLVVD